jgi:hypothetical protein
VCHFLGGGVRTHHKTHEHKLTHAHLRPLFLCLPHFRAHSCVTIYSPASANTEHTLNTLRYAGSPPPSLSPTPAPTPRLPPPPLPPPSLSRPLFPASFSKCGARHTLMCFPLYSIHLFLFVCPVDVSEGVGEGRGIEIEIDR